MKISLLLDREPFGEILEETLSRHLTAVYGRPQKVMWCEGAPKKSDLLAKRAGLWLCNQEINAVFSVGAESRVFEVPWREYLGGASALQIGAHAGYLAAATAPLSRWAMASHHLWVDPDLDDAQSTLILGGNTRVRLFDFDRGLVTTIQKSRFDPAVMTRELDVRLSRGDLLAPPIVEVLEGGRAFVEPLISGTNADRSLGRQRVQEALLKALETCYELGASSEQVESESDWVTRMLEDCRAASARIEADPRGVIQSALGLAERLGAMISSESRSSTDQVLLGMSHGDLQPGNVLIDKEKAWIIDWERVDLRILGYDGMTLVLNSRRSPSGLLTRAQQLAQSPEGDALTERVQQDLQQEGNERSVRRRLLMFFLEEVRFHLEENAIGPMSKATPALSQLVEELSSIEEVDFWNGN